MFLSRVFLIRVMNQRLLALAFFALALSSFAWSASLQSAVSAVAQDYLNDGEKAEIYPPVKISHGGSDYWVVAMLVDGSVSGFAALDSSSLEPEVSQAVNERLFKAAGVMRGFLELKDSAAGQNQWFFSQANAEFFSNLSRFLDQERENDLAFVRKSISEKETADLVSEMQSLLSEMSVFSSEIASETREQMGFEASFFREPGTKDLDALKEKSLAPRDSFEKLSGMAFDYESKKTRLKQSLLSSLLSDPVLLQYADSPPELQAVHQKKTVFLSNAQGISGVFDSASINAINFSESFQSRSERSSAKSEIYADDVAFEENTGRSSLAEAAEYILLEQNKPYWKNTDAVARFQSNWARALSGFDAGNHAVAREYAVKAKAEAARVIRDGFIEADDYDLSNALQQVLIGAIILMVVFGVVRALAGSSRRRKGRQSGGDSYNVGKP